MTWQKTHPAEIVLRASNICGNSRLVEVDTRNIDIKEFVGVATTYRSKPAD